MKTKILTTLKICSAFILMLFSYSCKKNYAEEVYSSNSETSLKLDSIAPTYKDSQNLRMGFSKIKPIISTQRQLISSSFDYTNRLQVSIWAEYVDGQHNHAEVSVDPDFVLIGGGARTSDFGSSYGVPEALLTSSYPKDDGTFSTFVADSKDHVISYSHRLWVYAIGMKMYDIGQLPIDPYYIKSSMSLTKTTSSSAAHPSSTTCIPSGYSFLSGGAKVNYQGAGSLLTRSMFPIGGGTCWTAESKDHGISSPATVECYVLSILPSNISQFGTLQISEKFAVVTAKSNKIATVTLNTNDNFGGLPWLIAGVGGQSAYTGNGRLLWEMYPVTPNLAQISDKDHLYAASGSLYGHLTMIRKL
jgi:hypothetical protein